MFSIVFIIIVFATFTFWREWLFAQKLRFYQKFVDELPFEAMAVDENKRFQLVSGEAVEDPKIRRWLIGKTDIEYWNKKKGVPEIGRKRAEKLQSAIDKRETLSFEEKLIYNTGEVRFFVRRLKPVFDKKGKLIMVLGFGFDITEDRKREQTLEKLNRELNRSNEDLTNFAHVASHDLKAPLRNITSFLQLLQRRNKDRFDSTDHEYIGFVMNSTRQMHNLIESLLNYSQIDKQNDAPILVNLNRIVEITQHNLSRQMTERNAVVSSDPLPNVTAYDFHIKQIFQNLVQNGLKYNRSPRPHIHISTVKKGDDIIFCVKDNGIGISSEFHEPIFQVFRRLHSASQFEGSGIGLAACKRIVAFYEGTIWLESKEGEGTTFFFTLPKALPVFQASMSPVLAS